jgi:ATP-dependent 26S proteasome regulatory subunit
METFDGISILTTNQRGNLDPAFIRRLQFIVEFPMPDNATRLRLWSQSLPSVEHLDTAIDLDLFAHRFPVSGGHIKNIGLAAAHLAAATKDGIVRPEHLVRATYRELEKTGLARSRADFGPLAPLLPGSN